MPGDDLMAEPPLLIHCGDCPVPRDVVAQNYINYGVLRRQVINLQVWINKAFGQDLKK